jgi:hypothetical protein
LFDELVRDANIQFFSEKVDCKFCSTGWVYDTIGDNCLENCARYITFAEQKCVNTQKK